MNRIVCHCFCLLAALAAQGATNLPPANALLLSERTVIELTMGLSQYEDPPQVRGKLTSIGSGVATILVNRWAAEFATLHPEADLDIQGGGSVDGLTKLLEGKTDMVPMSRPVPAADLARFKSKFGYEPAQVVVAQDAIGVYVHKDNPVTGITFAQMDAVYSREPKRGGGRPEFWRDLGVAGPLANERIVRYSPSHVHGTYMFLQDEILQGADYRFDVRFEAVPSSLAQAVGADPAGIGCGSVMFATARTRFVPVQAADGRYLLPSYENTVTGRYPLVRPMRIVFHQKPGGGMNPVAREFLRFAVSRRGQRIIGLAESYPLTAEQQQEALRTIGESPAAKAAPPRRITSSGK